MKKLVCMFSHKKKNDLWKEQRQTHCHYLLQSSSYQRRGFRVWRLRGTTACASASLPSSTLIETKPLEAHSCFQLSIWRFDSIYSRSNQLFNLSSHPQRLFLLIIDCLYSSTFWLPIACAVLWKHQVWSKLDYLW